MTSHGIPALPAVLANQRAFSCHVTTIVQGRQTLNVVLPTMGNTKSLMQLLDIHRPTPCITPLGLESDIKNLYCIDLMFHQKLLGETSFARMKIGEKCPSHTLQTQKLAKMSFTHFFSFFCCEPITCLNVDYLLASDPIILLYSGW